MSCAARAKFGLIAASCALVVVVCASSTVHAQRQPRARVVAEEASDQLSEGRRRYGDLDFAGAVEALRRALAVSGTSEALRLEAYEYLGASYLVLEQRSDARAAFLEMLAIDPYHALREPTGSPKIATFVARLRAEVAPDAALDPDVRIACELPRAGRVGSALRVIVRTAGGAAVASVRVRVRGQTDETWETIEAEPDGARFVATIPARAASDLLELYAEARDERGRLLARAGAPSAPLSIEIRATVGAPRATALYERWWFWTAVGVVVVGASIGVGLAATSGERAPPGTLAPGRVELP